MTQVLRTQRLAVRYAVPDDAELFHSLWTDPRIMDNVGFPEGIPVGLDELRARIIGEEDSPFDRLLVVEESESGEVLGECNMHLPDRDGISTMDIKLLPEHWGRGLGTELKEALVSYLFRNTECREIRSSPNVSNLSSIRMQERAGFTRIGEETYRFPDSMASYTRPVHCYIYSLTRETWLVDGNRES